MFDLALKIAAQELEKAKSRDLLEEYVVIGAIAMARVKVIRSTGDIDIAVKLGDRAVGKLAEDLKSELLTGDFYDPLKACINFQPENTNVNVQLIQFYPGIENAAFTDIQYRKIDGVNIPFASWGSLIILKLYAGSASDLQDAENILSQNLKSDQEFDNLMKIAGKLRLSKKLLKIKK